MNERMREVFPRQPVECSSGDEVRRMFDGYDTGVLYADDHAGQLFQKLAELGVDGDTAIMISADHGETLGELNVYGDHQTADELTSRVPMILKWPGLEGSDGRADAAFHYQFDVAASILELLGTRVPRSWDAQSFAEALRAGRSAGRDHLVLSQAAWTCQRSVRWDDWLAIRTWHDGHHPFPEWMLFDLANDPHETRDLAAEHPERIEDAVGRLEAWHAEMERSAERPGDPMQTVLAEGGPFHVRGQLEKYALRLRETGRAAIADRLVRS